LIHRTRTVSPGARAPAQPVCAAVLGLVLNLWSIPVLRFHYRLERKAPSGKLLDAEVPEPDE